MIAQHFIRSPSLKEKLNDRYAGLELVTGKYCFKSEDKKLIR